MPPTFLLGVGCAGGGGGVLHQFDRIVPPGNRPLVLERDLPGLAMTLRAPSFENPRVDAVGRDVCVTLGQDINLINKYKLCILVISEVFLF